MDSEPLIKNGRVIDPVNGLTVRMAVLFLLNLAAA
jgi:hypothetical protein